jgi:hypothetical protein
MSAQFDRDRLGSVRDAFEYKLVFSVGSPNDADAPSDVH